ncbi:MAG: shikimate dehydrogenase [Candidatus Moranbacteria bacterium]|nr:shikimate dehydrogenase [Candidatus Moranbacteria bacterium]
MKISPKTKICMIIGDPVDHSLSPLMHNSAYKALGIDNKFVFLGSNVKSQNLEKVMKALKFINFRGITCTIPHKENVMRFLDHVDPIAQKIGAVNTIVIKNNKYYGYNTDWIGTVEPLKKLTSLKNKKTALLGAGGAARAMIFGLTKEGADLKIFNRTFDKAKKLANEFNCKAGPLKEIEEVKNFDIIINSTSIGMKPDSDRSLVDKKCLNKNQIVFDAVYSPLKTKLIKNAESKGAKTIYGIEMLLYQGFAQFEYYTAKKAPKKIMRDALTKNLNLQP